MQIEPQVPARADSQRNAWSGARHEPIDTQWRERLMNAQRTQYLIPVKIIERTAIGRVAVEECVALVPWIHPLKLSVGINESACGMLVSPLSSGRADFAAATWTEVF